jgi:redox-sensitive bicupin YhaK (pirin superfamily)
MTRLIPAVETSDGAGVKLKRSLGSVQGLRLDPFLMLDEFGSDDAADYIAGFPPHPHRGFETVTYMLDGHMLHEDHLGNRGNLTSGGVQWMTAARGIIHSEMPQQEEGRMRGFQLWINLPAREKMKDPFYRDIPSDEIPEGSLENGGKVRVIAGEAQAAGGTVAGAVTGITTDPLYLDVHLPPGGEFRQPVVAGHSAFLYAYEGDITVGEGERARQLPLSHAGVLSDGDEVRISAGGEGARVLLLAARPLNEPVVQYGPFVMNSREEIEQAIRDYQAGTLARVARAD